MLEAGDIGAIEDAVVYDPEAVPSGQGEWRFVIEPRPADVASMVLSALDNMAHKVSSIPLVCDLLPCALPAARCCLLTFSPLISLSILPSPSPLSFRSPSSSLLLFLLFPPLQIGPDVWPYVNWQRPRGDFTPLAAYTAEIHHCKQAVGEVFARHAAHVEALHALLAPFGSDLNTDPARVALDVRAYLADRCVIVLGPLVRAIQWHVDSQARVLASVPPAACVGVFEASMASVRDHMRSLHASCANLLLQALSEWCDNTARTVLACAAAVRGAVRARCKTAEEVRQATAAVCELEVGQCVGIVMVCADVTLCLCRCCLCLCLCVHTVGEFIC